MDAADFADPDLKCAAQFMAAHVSHLESSREALWKPFKALAERLRPLSAWLSARQAPAVKAVTGSLHFAFISIMVVLLHWPDTTLPLRYLEAFPRSGPSNLRAP